MDCGCGEQPGNRHGESEHELCLGTCAQRRARQSGGVWRDGAGLEDADEPEAMALWTAGRRELPEPIGAGHVSLDLGGDRLAGRRYGEAGILDELRSYLDRHHGCRGGAGNEWRLCMGHLRRAGQSLLPRACYVQPGRRGHGPESGRFPHRVIAGVLRQRRFDEQRRVVHGGGQRREHGGSAEPAKGDGAGDPGGVQLGAGRHGGH